MSEKQARRARTEGEKKAALRRRPDAAEIIGLIQEYHEEILKPYLQEVLDAREKNQQPGRWKRFWRWLSS